jgi:hypothetical protein
MKQKTTSPLRHLWPRLGLLLALLLFFSNGTHNDSLAQSFPTFTPTPGPATNTPPPSPTNTPRPAQPTNTPVPGQPTNTPAVQEPIQTTTPVAGSPTATAVGSQPQPLATAEPCSPNPTLQVLRTINVRQGPGDDYALLGQLTTGDIRPLVGRAASATWWVIELETGGSGWVMNVTTAVSIQGYIGLLPLVSPPAIGGNTPTPGPTWQPTPNPNCTITPTATGQAVTATTSTTPTATATPVADEVRGQTAVREANSDADASEPEQAADLSETAETPVGDPMPTPASLTTDPADSSSDWLPIAGLVLILGGIAAAFIIRRW